MTKAFILPSFDEPPALRDLPGPTPGDGEVLVRVHASSVNQVDAMIAGGMLKGMFEHEFPVVVGRDYAGVVEQVGPAVTRYAPGDEVFGFVVHANPKVHDGTWAELIVVPENDSIARRPSSVGLEEAGAAPLAGITALACLDALGLSDGDTLLIVGATGGVGSFAVQLAAHAGVTVIAPALPEDEQYLRDLGAAELIDREGDLVAAVRERHPDGADALIDLVSYAPDGFDANAAALEAPGRGASPLSAAGDGPGRANVMATPTPENLERLAGLIDAGAVKVPIQAVHDLDQVAEALQAFGAGHKQGKRAIRVA